MSRMNEQSSQKMGKSGKVFKNKLTSHKNKNNSLAPLGKEVRKKSK